MNDIVTRLCLCVLAWNVMLPFCTTVSADNPALTLQTARVDGLTVSEQIEQLKMAREIIQKCDRIVVAMKEQQSDGATIPRESLRQVIDAYRPIIEELQRKGESLKLANLKSGAGRIPEVTNIVILSLGYHDANGFQTMLRLYEQDREKAVESLEECEQRVPRKWTSRTGTSSVIAEMLKLESKDVTIRRLDNGKVLTIPREKLSLNDRHFMNRWEREPEKGQNLLREIAFEKRID